MTEFLKRAGASAVAMTAVLTLGGWVLRPMIREEIRTIVQEQMQVEHKGPQAVLQEQIGQLKSTVSELRAVIEKLEAKLDRVTERVGK